MVLNFLSKKLTALLLLCALIFAIAIGGAIFGCKNVINKQAEKVDLCPGLVSDYPHNVCANIQDVGIKSDCNKRVFDSLRAGPEECDDPGLFATDPLYKEHLIKCFNANSDIYQPCVSAKKNKILFILLFTFIFLFLSCCLIGCSTGGILGLMGLRGIPKKTT